MRTGGGRLSPSFRLAEFRFKVDRGHYGYIGSDAGASEKVVVSIQGWVIIDDRRYGMCITVFKNRYPFGGFLT